MALQFCDSRNYATYSVKNEKSGAEGVAVWGVGEDCYSFIMGILR